MVNILRQGQKPALAALFILIAAGFCYYSYFFASWCSGYVIGDWFIDFSDGFVRRGISGEVVGWLSGLLNIPLNYALIPIQVLIYGGFLLLFYILLSGKKITPWYFIALFSPATLLFIIFDPNAAGRKEIILFFLFAFYLFGLKKNWIKSFPAILCFSFALLTATLFHELVFFFTPYFVLAAFLSSRVNARSFQLSRVLLIVAGSWLIIVPIYLFGQYIPGEIICAGLKQKGLPESICYGILSWPHDYGFRNVLLFAGESNYLFVYGTSFILGLIPFLLFVKNHKQTVVTPGLFLAAFTILILFSLPLFFLAVDWGRWVNIHFILVLMTSSLLLQDKSDEKKDALPENNSGREKLFRLNSSGKLALFLFAISYIAFWSMPHFGYSKVFSFTRNFYSIKHLVVDIFRALF
jgi:hypothetical protein